MALQVLPSSLKRVDQTNRLSSQPKVLSAARGRWCNFSVLHRFLCSWPSPLPGQRIGTEKGAVFTGSLLFGFVYVWCTYLK